MKTLSIGFGIALTLVLGACGSDTVKELEEIKEAACKCKDAACLDKLEDKGKGLMDKVKKLDGDDKEKAEKIAGELMDCVMEIQMKG